MSKPIELDARGLQCPMPLLKLKQQLNQMQAGDYIEVKTTDAGSVRDFNAFTQQVGHKLHRQTERLFIRKVFSVPIAENLKHRTTALLGLLY